MAATLNEAVVDAVRAAGATAQLEGYDAGVSFRSVDDPSTGVTWTVVSNTSEGAWPIARVIADHLAA